MINPSQAWCLQISTGSECWPMTPGGSKSGCSNCTRGLAHEKRRYLMSLDHIEKALQAVCGFATESAPCPQGRRKVVGLFGAEPLLHPRFPEIVDLFIHYIPDALHRGLWTSLDWPKYISRKWGAAKPHVDRLLGPDCDAPWGVHRETHLSHFEKPGIRRVGYLNWNRHGDDQVCEHQPVWVSANFVTNGDEKKKWDLISECWVQKNWSPIVGYDANNEPKFYFCEVANSHDRLFDLGVGIPLTPDCWRHSITFSENADGVKVPQGFYADQINACCPGCGSCVPLNGRRDIELKDDISPDNLERLRAIGSPMVARGDFVEFGEFERNSWQELEHRRSGWDPQVYVKRKLV